MKKQVSLTALLAGVVGIVVVTALVLAVKPQRDEGMKLDGEIVALETQQVDLAKKLRESDGEPLVEIDFADLFELAKAMPDDEDMPGIILELDSIATSTGVKFVSIAPAPVESNGVFRSLPITLTFQGNYYDLTDFLYRLRSLVGVRDQALSATGRLYTLDSLDMHEGPAGFPKIEATLTLSAYVFGPGETPPAAATATPAATAPASTTPAATTPASTAPAATTPATTTPATTEPPGPAPGTEALEGTTP